MIRWPTCAHHVVLSKYAISSQSDISNSRKWQKSLFLAIWINQKGNFLIFEWSSMSYTMAKSCTPFSSIRICIIKSIRCTKLKKRSKNLIFGYLDHSKRLFSDFWMIQHDFKDGQIVSTNHFYHNMQYEVNPMLQTREIGRNPYGSFKRAETRIRVVRKIFLKINKIFPGHAVFAGSSQKVWIFRLNNKKWLTKGKLSVKIESKSKKGHFWHVFVIIEWSRFFLGNPALLRHPTHCPLSSCQKSKKSIAGKYHNFLW